MSLNSKALLRWLPLVALLTSCSHLIHLDRAQNAFSEGAQLENSTQFNTSAATANSPGHFYSIAYSEIQEALKGDSKLKRDTVLASAYAIKALSEWKLKRYGAARLSRSLALAELNEYEKNGIRQPRDKAVMTALEGLIQIDEVNDELYQYYDGQNPAPDPAREFYLTKIASNQNGQSGKIEKALEIIESAKALATGNRETQVYLTLAQLAGMKTWSDAFDRYKNILDTDQSLSSTDRQQRNEELRRSFFKKYEEEKNKYMESLGDNLPNAGNDPVYNYWKFLLTN